MEVNKKMEQNTDKWLEWRRQGIGASDSPAIMGASPYKTARELWLEKTGQVKEPEGNWATRRGTEMEPKARAHYELMYNVDMPPALVEHKEYPFLRASLDGFNGDVVLEIKCPGKDDHALAMSGKVPEKYYPQLQHQLMVTNASCVHYWSFDGERGTLVTVFPDLEYIKKLAEKELNFWNCVVNKIDPGASDKDFEEISDVEFQTVIDEWKLLEQQSKELEKRQALLRDEIIARAAGKHPKLKYNGVNITRSTRKGTVDYSKIPSLQNENLDLFRKPAKEVYTVEVAK